MSKKVKECFKYILPSILAAALLCVILIIKGIYPFGSETIDYYDMAQQISAFYYHTYDMLHGTKAFFYDWFTGLGVNMAMSTSGCSNLSLFNLFFLFVKRDYLLNSLSVFLMIKMMFMAFTMYFYIHRTRSINYLYEVIFSVGYAFCGFVLLLYMTNQWMDIAIFFPLIIYYAEKLLKEGKSLGYIITVSIVMINSYYISFMILIYIIVMTGLKLVCDRVYDGKGTDTYKARRYHIIRLFTSTVMAIGISCFILIPQLIQTFASARFGYATSGSLLSWYGGIITQVQGVYTTRYFTLYGMSFAAAIVFFGLIKDKLEKREKFMIIGACFLILSELLFESINLFWHYGSYIQYPIRNGFMLNFTVAVCAAYVLEKRGSSDAVIESDGETVRRLPVVYIVTALIMAVIGIAALYYGISTYSAHPGLNVRTVFHFVVIIMSVCFIIYLLVLFLSRKNHELTAMVFPLIACEFIFYGFLMFGQPTFITGYSEEPEDEGEYIRICNQVRDAFNIDSDRLNRIKNPDESMNSNYGLCLERASLSNWTHLISPDLTDGVSKWGYTVQYTRMLDSGGTLLTDALLGVTNTISLVPQDDTLYEPIDKAVVEIDHRTGETAEYTYYRNRYTLPWGLKLKENADINMGNADMVSLHNDIYFGLTGDDTPIAEWVYGEDYRNRELVRPYMEQLGLNPYDYDDSDFLENRKSASEEAFLNGTVNPHVEGEINDTISVTGNKLLYFTANSLDEEYYDYEIYVNGEVIPIPSIKESDNTKYPAHFNNNAVYLGNFTDEDVELTLKIDFCEDYNNYDFNICSLDFDMIKSLCMASTFDTPMCTADDKSLTVLTYASENQTMILPVAYDEGFLVKVNGNEVKSSRYAGMFTAIPLLDGENEIVMEYTPSGMKAGIIVTIVSVVLTAIALLVERFGKGWVLIPPENERETDAFLRSVCLGLYYVILLLMYAIPTVYGVIATIVNLFR